MYIRKEDIEQLILAGRCEESEYSPDYFKKRDFLNRMHWRDWRLFADALNDEELILLYKGLIKIEKRLKWLGGSVAGAIWIYHIIQERGLDKTNYLANFGLRESENEYVPFGSPVYDRKSI